MGQSKAQGRGQDRGQGTEQRTEHRLQVMVPTFCRHSVFSFFLFRHLAAAILFLSLRLFFLSSSSGATCEVQGQTHQEARHDLLGCSVWAPGR